MTHPSSKFAAEKTALTPLMKGHPTKKALKACHQRQTDQEGNKVGKEAPSIPGCAPWALSELTEQKGLEDLEHAKALVDQHKVS